jgi:protein-disulfide isomerase
MKYAQLIIGLLAGTAIGGAVVVSAGNPLAGAGLNFGGGVDRESVKQIVRDTISEEPQLIMDSVQKFQEARRKQTTQNANELLKDPAMKAEIYEFADAAFVGPKDAKKVVVEFFDYDCPACHIVASADLPDAGLTFHDADLAFVAKIVAPRENRAVRAVLDLARGLRAPPLA